MNAGPGDVLHMFIEEAAEHVAQLGAVGKTLAEEWQATKASIDGALGGLGGDEIGQAFSAGFLPACQAVRAVADSVPPAFDNLHTGGNQAVALYRAQAAPPPALQALAHPSI